MKTQQCITRGGKLGTLAQCRAWASFGDAACGWKTLAEEQYQAWDAAAKQENRRRHLRPGHRLNACNLFTEINSHQGFLGLPPYLYPPERPAFILDPFGPLVAGDGRDGITLKLGVPKALAGHILVFGAPPCSPGKRYCDKFRYLGLLPTPKGGVSDISILYYERCGMPWPGSRVIIATQQQLDGWRDLLCRLDVVVPGGQGLAALPASPRITPGA